MVAEEARLKLTWIKDVASSSCHVPRSLRFDGSVSVSLGHDLMSVQYPIQQLVILSANLTVASLLFIKILSMLISQTHIQCNWMEIQEYSGVYLLTSG